MTAPVASNSIDAYMERIRDTLRRIDLATRPVNHEVADALERVWNELPNHAQVANQTMGHHTTAWFCPLC